MNLQWISDRPSMRKIRTTCLALLALTTLPFLAPAQTAVPGAAECISLEGKPLPASNAIERDRVKVFTAPALLLFHSRAGAPKGTALLLPGGGYHILEMKMEGENTARFLNEQGFDVALLQYHVSSGPHTRDLALADSLQAFRLLKARAPALGLHGGRFAIMGYSAGGHLAARTAQNLADNEQPDDLILVYPAYLHEFIPGTVIPAVTPPRKPGRNNCAG